MYRPRSMNYISTYFPSTDLKVIFLKLKILQEDTILNGVRFIISCSCLDRLVVGLTRCRLRNQRCYLKSLHRFVEGGLFIQCLSEGKE